MKKIFILSCLFYCIISCNKDEAYIDLNNSYEIGEELSAGKLTTTLLGANAFDQAVPGLPINTDLLFFVGNSLFKQN
jgi:CxxC motif-containing protein (DUF1111 family)